MTGLSRFSGLINHLRSHGKVFSPVNLAEEKSRNICLYCDRKCMRCTCKFTPAKRASSLKADHMRNLQPGLPRSRLKKVRSRQGELARFLYDHKSKNRSLFRLSRDLGRSKSARSTGLARLM